MMLMMIPNNLLIINFHHTIAALHILVTNLMHQALLDDRHFGILVKHIQVAFSDILLHDIAEVVAT